MLPAGPLNKSGQGMVTLRHLLCDVFDCKNNAPHELPRYTQRSHGGGLMENVQLFDIVHSL